MLWRCLDDTMTILYNIQCYFLGDKLFYSIKYYIMMFSGWHTVLICIVEIFPKLLDTFFHHIPYYDIFDDRLHAFTLHTNIQGTSLTFLPAALFGSSCLGLCCGDGQVCAGFRTYLKSQICNVEIFQNCCNILWHFFHHILYNVWRFVAGILFWRLINQYTRGSVHCGQVIGLTQGHILYRQRTIHTYST